MQPVSNDPIRCMQVSRLAHPTAVASWVGQDVTGTLSESNFFAAILFFHPCSPCLDTII